MTVKNFTLTQNEAHEETFAFNGVASNAKLIFILGNALIVKRSANYFGSEDEIEIGTNQFIVKFTAEETAKLSTLGYTHRVVQISNDDSVEEFTGAVTVAAGTSEEPEYQYDVVNGNNIRTVTDSEVPPTVEDDYIIYDTTDNYTEQLWNPELSVGKRLLMVNDSDNYSVNVEYDAETIISLAANTTAKLLATATGWKVVIIGANINV